MNTLTPAGTPADLQALRELPLPAPVSYAPQTIGWLFVGAVLLLIACALAWAAWRRYERTRYRRDALAELKRIDERLKEDPGALAEIAPLIKRTALAVLPRERVASASGATWLVLLRDMHGAFDDAGGALLYASCYAPRERLASVTPEQAARLVRMARDWIEHHHVEV
jgi:hypothetical protein